MWTFVVDPFRTDDRFHGKFEAEKEAYEASKQYELENQDIFLDFHASTHVVRYVEQEKIYYLKMKSQSFGMIEVS